MKKFSTSKQYFTIEEQRGFDDFLKLDIKEGMIYTNEKGKKIETGRIDYPEELILPNHTMYYPETQDGVVHYYTPECSAIGSKVIKIQYVEDGKWKMFTHLEFMKWLGKEWAVNDRPRKPVPDYIKARLDMVKSVEKAKVETKEELKEKTENWNPTGKSNTKAKNKK